MKKIKMKKKSCILFYYSFHASLSQKQFSKNFKRNEMFPLTSKKRSKTVSDVRIGQMHKCTYKYVCIYVLVTSRIKNQRRHNATYNTTVCLINAGKTMAPKLAALLSNWWLVRGDRWSWPVNRQCACRRAVDGAPPHEISMRVPPHKNHHRRKSGTDCIHTYVQINIL